MSEERDPSFTFSKSIVLDGDSYDETVDMDISDDDRSTNGEEFLFGRLKRHPKDRRKRHEQMAMCMLLGFLGIMFVALIPLSRNKQNDSVQVSDASKPLEGETKAMKKVYCSGKLTYNTYEWLRQDIQDTAELCDPEFQPERLEADLSKPVKVFLMMGEANMVGAGQTHGDVLGTLDYTVMTEKRFTHLVDYNKEWRDRSNVRYVAIRDEAVVERNEWLGVKENHHFFGPELQFGYVLGELFDEPVLLIKSCAGHQSLGGDLLPPGRERFNYGGYTYAGYGESPRRWRMDTEPIENGWYAGHAYDKDLENAREILDNIGSYYPGATEYELAGIAFWHGDSDRRDPAYVAMYQSNLKFFIDAVRRDLGAPDAKFAIATVGQRGNEMTGGTLEVLNSQLAVGTLFRDFQSNVATVDIRRSWRTPYLPGNEGDSSQRDVTHYGNNAETVMEVGNALGLTMAQLLHGTIQS